jgi:hypothetical protein
MSLFKLEKSWTDQNTKHFPRKKGLRSRKLRIVDGQSSKE